MLSCRRGKNAGAACFEARKNRLVTADVAAGVLWRISLRLGVHAETALAMPAHQCQTPREAAGCRAARWRPEIASRRREARSKRSDGGRREMPLLFAAIVIGKP